MYIPINLLAVDSHLIYLRLQLWLFTAKQRDINPNIHGS